MKKVIFFIAFIAFSFSVSAQIKSTRNIGREQEISVDAAAALTAVADSSNKKVGRLVTKDSLKEFVKRQTNGRITNVEEVLALKANATEATRLDRRADSLKTAVNAKLTTANALNTFKTIDTYSNDTAIVNADFRNNINYVRGISDTRDDSLKVAIDAKTDAQTLSINGNTLSILRGNSVNLNTLDSNRYLKRYSKTFVFRNKNVSSDTITTVAKVSAPTATVIFVTASVSSSVFYYEIRLSQSLTDGTWYLVNPKHYSGYGLSIEFSLKRSGSDYYIRCKTADPMMSYGWSTFWSQNVYFDVVAMKSDATASDVAATNLSSSNSSIVESFDNITAAVASSTTLSADATVVVFSSSSSITATIPPTLGSGKTYSFVNTGTGIVTISYNNSTLFTIVQYEKKKICLIGSNWIEIL